MNLKNYVYSEKDFCLKWKDFLSKGKIGEDYNPVPNILEAECSFSAFTHKSLYISKEEGVGERVNPLINLYLERFHASYTHQFYIVKAPFFSMW